MFLFFFTSVLSYASSTPVILDGEFTPKDLFLSLKDVSISVSENEPEVEFKRTKNITCMHSLKNNSYQCRFKVSSRGEVSSFDQDLEELNAPYRACYEELFPKLYGSKGSAYYGNLYAAHMFARLQCELQ